MFNSAKDNSMLPMLPPFAYFLNLLTQLYNWEGYGPVLQHVHGTYILLHVKIVGSIFCRKEKYVTEYFVDMFKMCGELVFYLSEDP